MKWPVVALIILGLLAATFASLLVRAYRAEAMAERYGRGETEVVVAVRSLPAMSWITAQHITVKKAPRRGLDADCFTDPTQVIGKVLAVPVVKDQVLTRSSLIPEGSGAQLAAVLPHGMRAVSVPVARHSVMGGLLYPGCLVDVIATFNLRGRTAKGEAISRTLLNSVRVLAVQGESIVSKTAREGKRSRPGGSSGQLTVTLMVNTRQAEALQLAMGSGKITLAMKNPLDHKVVDSDATILSQGRLTKLGGLGPSVFVAPSGIGDFDVNDLMVPSDSNLAVEQAAVSRAVSTERFRSLYVGDTGGSWRSPQWRVTVIRGKEVKEEVLEIQE